MKEVCVVSVNEPVKLLIHFIIIVPGVVEVVVTFEESVTWAPPLEPNGVIINYQVVHFTYQSSVRMISPLLDNETTVYSIGGLSK